MKRRLLWIVVVLAMLGIGSVLGIALLAKQLPPTAKQFMHDVVDGDLAAVEADLRRGADPNLPERWGFHDSEGNTPLTAAAGLGHAEIVLLLLRYGADIDRLDCSSDSPGVTALTSAVTLSHYKTCQVLLEAGADPNVPNNPRQPGDPGKWTALDWALQGSDFAMAELLRKHGGRESGRRSDQTSAEAAQRGLIAPLYFERRTTVLVKGEQISRTLLIEFVGHDPASFAVQLAWATGEANHAGKLHGDDVEETLNVKIARKGPGWTLTPVDELNPAFKDLSIDVQAEGADWKLTFSRKVRLPRLADEPVDFSGIWLPVGKKR